ncbi:MAG: DUF5615 family PIN-like protein [Longimicrobiales bacterium]|nr:DUF5615 family PIN-like protein [Longimicrobiales bacterium]
MSILLGLGEASDSRIWDATKDDGFVIVSKDSDFAAMSVLRGHPPKVIWVALGNCTSDEIQELLLSNAEDIRKFGEIDEESYLVLR